VVFHSRHADLIARFDARRHPACGDKVDRLGGGRAEHDLLCTARADEARKVLRALS